MLILPVLSKSVVILPSITLLTRVLGELSSAGRMPWRTVKWDRGSDEEEKAMNTLASSSTACLTVNASTDPVTPRAAERSMVVKEPLLSALTA